MKPLLCASILMSLTTSTAFARGEDTKLPPCPAPAAGMAIDEVGMPVDKKDKKGKGIATGGGDCDDADAACPAAEPHAGEAGETKGGSGRKPGN